MRAVVFGFGLIATMFVPVRSEGQMPAPGAKVRVVTDSSRVIGVLTASTPDSIRIALSQRPVDTVATAVASVRELAVASGTRRHVRQGLMYGALGGAVLGAAAGFASFSPCTDTGLLACYLEPETRGQATAVGAGVGAVLGTALGALVGAFVISDRWTLVPTLSVH